MRYSLFPLNLFVLWLLSYIIYPLWYLPQENIRGLAFGILLIFFAVNFLFLAKFVSFLKWDSPGVSCHSIKGEKAIWGSGIIYFLLQVYPVLMPVLSRNDENHYLSSSLVYYLKISSFWERVFRCPLWCGVLALSILCVYIIRKRTLLNFLVKRKFLTVAIFSLLSIIYYFLFSKYVSLDSFFYLFHYPLFSKFFYIISYSVVGAREHGPRFVQAIFGFLSAVYLYRLVFLFRTRRVAIFSFLMWLFMPACLFYGNLAMLVNGISFFFISAFYYLLKYYKEKNIRSLFLGAFILSMGTMYQQPVVVALFIYCLFVLALLIFKKISFARDRAMLILPVWAVLVTVLPFLIITKFIYVPFGGYVLSPNNFFSWTTYLEQIRLTFSGISVVHILFLAVGIITVFKKRDILSLFTCIWFGGYFIFQIVYPFTGVFRLLVPYFPVIAIWIGEGIGVVSRKKVFNGLAVLALIYTILTSCIWALPPLSKKIVLYHNIRSRYVPYPDAISYLKTYLKGEYRCLSPGHSSPEKFYCLKFGLSPLQIDHTWWWAGGVYRQTEDNLYEYAKSHKIKFCLFPSGEWPGGFLNFGLRDRLVSGMDNRFILKKEFLSGKNKLYLLEVK